MATTNFDRDCPLITLPCVVSLLWALIAAFDRGEYLWAAASIAVSAAAVASLAVWRRNEVLAFVAGLGVNLALSLLVLALHLTSPFVPLVQAKVIGSAGVALAWLGARRLLPAWPAPGPLLAVQAVLGLSVHTLLLLAPLGLLFLMPGVPLDAEFTAVGSLAGWLAMLLAGAAVFRHLADIEPRGRIHVLGIVGLSAGILAACAAIPWDTGNYLSYHVLLAAWCVLGLGAVAAGSVTFSLRSAGLTSGEEAEPHAARFAAIFRPRLVQRWLEVIGLAILLLALRGGWEDPLRPTSSALAVLVVALMAGALAIWSGRERYVYASGLLLDLIGVLFWSAWGPSTWISFLLTNALGLALASAFWTGLELALQRAGGVSPLITQGIRGLTPPARPDMAVLPFAHFAVHLALGLVVLVVTMAVASSLGEGALHAADELAWTTVFAVALALCVALWDRRAWLAVADLYVLGLAAVNLALHGLTRTPPGFGWSAALALACYVLLTAGVQHWSRRSLEDWFVPAQAVVAGVVVALSLWMCLDFAARIDRLAGPAAVLLLIPVALLLGRAGGVSPLMSPRNQGADAPRSPDLFMDWLRPVALALGALAAAEIGWACPDPAGGTVAWLHRNVLLMVALAVMTALYGVGLPRWLSADSPWVRWGRRFGPMLGGLAALVLLLLLVQEFQLYDRVTHRTPMAWPAVLVVLAALVTLMVCGVLFAVVPGRDPFGLSERRRTLYVYAVEVLLVLLFVHLRLTMPFLFRGWAVRYWPVIVMLIAFAGVGLSEFFERRKLHVLAGPLQRTGVFLPLLPLLSIWLRMLVAPALEGTINRDPELRPLLQAFQGFDRYAVLWLLAGGIYTFLAVTRRSFRFAVLAALAANFALWSLWAHLDYGFLVHPQFWLIPLALIVLTSEHFNRDRLLPELSAGLRYLGISMIYVSSTADLFIAGIGRSLWWPVVLAVLSVGGILTGILARVRAFLFLGISFLFLDVFTMIWYAAVDRYQTWVWWVSGIVLGAAILTLFAVFEKRRNDVLHLLEEIKRWD